MSEVVSSPPTQPSVTITAAELAELKANVERLENELAHEKSRRQFFKGLASGAKRIFHGVVAGLSTPEAVKAEKSLAAIVLTRLALYAPAVAVYVDLILKALGAPSVQ